MLAVYGTMEMTKNEDENEPGVKNSGAGAPAPESGRR